MPDLFDKYNVFDRRCKIDDLIKENKVRQATLILVDFVDDFTKDFDDDDKRKYRSDALLLCSDSKQYEDDYRHAIQKPDDLSRERRRILYSICDILDLIIDKYRTAA